MENKFKAGDRVVVQSDEYYKRHVGAVGTVNYVYDGGADVVIDNQDDGFDWHFEDHQISHYGQTLADLNVKAGDVVECVSSNGCAVDGKRYTISSDNKLGGYHVSYYNMSKFRIISRAYDNQWQVCEPDYTHQDNHEVSYHMGVPVAYRAVAAKNVDVEKRVLFELGEFMDCMYFHEPNATLRGKTLNGKPVGQWVIDMD